MFCSSRGFILLLALLTFSCQAHYPEEIRGLWVVRHTLNSEERIKKMVDDAKRAGFNTLLVQIRGRGDAFYESQLVPKAEGLSGESESFDPLSVVIAEARDKGMQVHAWFNVCLVGNLSKVPTSNQHVTLQHPEWLLRPESLYRSFGDTSIPAKQQVSRLQAEFRKTRGQGLFLDPTNSGARAHLVNVVKELLNKYKVDGLHLDYIRYPDTKTTFTPEAIALFKESIPETLRENSRQVSDPLVVTKQYPDLWAAFRRHSITELTRQISIAAKQTRPKILMSAAVIANREEALTLRGQDWFEWLEQGIVDIVCPMAYRTDNEQFKKEIEEARRSKFGHQVWAGIGSYKLDSDGVLAQIQLTRTLGVGGFVIFSYTSLAEEASARENFLTPIGNFLNTP